MTTGFSKKKILEFIKTYRERVILIGIVTIFALCIVVGITLQKKLKSGGKEFQAETVPKTVELKLQHKKEHADHAGETPQSASFFLKPLPDELLQQLTSLENFNEDVVAAKYVGMRVMWPAYFFTLQPTQGSKATVVLDAVEDGFGVVIESEIDISLYPKLRSLEPGKKLWIGGEIMAIDRSGTGTVYIKTEHLSFGDEPIPPASRQPAN